ncbi:hypothetical protein DSECCO2_602250 [anaerobic digester metagenome]
MPLPDRTAGRKDERVLGVRDLGGRFPLDGREDAQAVGHRKLLPVEDRRSRVLRRRAGPVQAVRIEASVGHPVVGGRHGGDLVKDRFRAFERKLFLVAHPAPELADDPPVFLRFAGCLLCLLPALDTPLGVRLGAVLLGVADGGQNDVGEFARLGHEDVLHDQELEVPEGLLDVVEVGIGEHRVLAHDVHRLDLTGLVGEDVDHLGDGVADPALGNILDAPHLHHLLPGRLVGDLLVAGVDVREGSHVAGALDVVLDADGVLGDAHRVDERGSIGRCDPLGRGPEALDRNPRDL